MERQPAVAHQFYPGTAAALEQELRRCVPAGATPRPALAVISPHAGYVYSGAVAGETLAQVVIPDTVLVMGPNHHGLGSAAALQVEGSWRMPMGSVPMASDLGRALLGASPLLTDDPVAHRREHSLEVQVPFLQYLNPRVRILPLVLAFLSLEQCRELGEAIGATLASWPEPVLLVASSDMSHYEPRVRASEKDRLALDRVLALDPAGLYRTVVTNDITMCGVIPATIALFAAKALGASSARLVRYTDSGAVTGDTSQVVGYAGVVIQA